MSNLSLGNGVSDAARQVYFDITCICIVTNVLGTLGLSFTVFLNFEINCCNLMNFYYLFYTTKIESIQNLN